MKQILRITSLILISVGLVYLSCTKEYSCEGCYGIKAPIAKAGKDTTIILPADSVKLDGSASYDPDGTITSYTWQKISGPSSFTIVNASAAKTVVKTLTAGVYQFELKVIDNENLSGKDTVQIIVNNPGQPNRPPIANAGPDQVITLPANTLTLNGAASSDPDNNITGYTWTKISGPSVFSISSPNAVQTPVTNLVQGIYQFELKVTDAGALFSKDTMQVQVTVVSYCTNRPVKYATLVPVGTLSTAKYGLISGTAGNKILFGGGWAPGIPNPVNSSRVDIYDLLTNTWSTSELTEPIRDGMVVASVGNKIFFAGGGENGWIDVTSRVDIYDAASNTWSTAQLSKARKYLSAATIGNKIFFAGGGTWELSYFSGTNVVDIYDNATNTWSTATLSIGRYELSATTVGNKIYFAGGLYDISTVSKVIDIYDNATNTWSTSQLNEGKASPAGILIDNKIFWAGGAKTSYQSGYQLSDMVEIRDINTGLSTFDCITPKAMFGTAVKDDNVVFFTGYNNGQGNSFDIYNKTTNTWSMGILPVNIRGGTIISVNNIIYVAGGEVNGVYSDQVWRLEF